MSEKDNLTHEKSSDTDKKKTADEIKLEMQKKYAEMAKNSLVKVQYSCSGNSCDVDIEDFDLENT